MELYFYDDVCFKIKDFVGFTKTKTNNSYISFNVLLSNGNQILIEKYLKYYTYSKKDVNLKKLFYSDGYLAYYNYTENHYDTNLYLIEANENISFAEIIMNNIKYDILKNYYANYPDCSTGYIKESKIQYIDIDSFKEIEIKSYEEFDLNNKI
jgi:hypothetical protein